MAITSQPTVLSAAEDAYINAGTTTRIQSFLATSGNLNIAIVSGAVSKISSPTGNVTVNFTQIPASSANFWWVEIANRGSNTVTFNGVTWDGVFAPTIASGTGKTVLKFYSTDGGTTIYGGTEFSSIA